MKESGKTETVFIMRERVRKKRERKEAREMKIERDRKRDKREHNSKVVKDINE